LRVLQYWTFIGQQSSADSLNIFVRSTSTSSLVMQPTFCMWHSRCLWELSVSSNLFVIFHVSMQLLDYG